MAPRGTLRAAAAAAALAAAAGHGAGMPGSESHGLSLLLREMEGGGRIRSFFQRWLMRGLPDVTVGAAKGPIVQQEGEGGKGLKEQTFISPPMDLQNGEIVNKWLPIDWPEGHIMVRSFSADVVHAQADGSPPPAEPCCGGPFEAPRATSFLHHWTVNKWQVTRGFFRDMVQKGGREFSANMDADGIYTLLDDAGFNDGADGPCWDSTLHVFFGIGNEVRGKTLDGKHDAYEFPEPYGIEFDMDAMRKKGEFMVLNTHLIDLRNVTNRRSCTECECSYLNSTGADKGTVGGLSCCHSTSFNGARCPVEQGVEKTPERYYIRYTVKWQDFHAESRPLEVITFDATDNNTKWGDFPFVPGGFHESHAALKQDPLSMATVNDRRSGVYDGHGACHVEYFVPHCHNGTSCQHTIHNSWEVPYPMEFVFIRTHFHIGGASAKLRTEQGDLCSSTPTYDASGFLVDITTCGLTDGSQQPLQTLGQGERLYMEVSYKQDDLPHFGAMAMSFVYVHIPKAHKRATRAAPGFLV